MVGATELAARPRGELRSSPQPWDRPHHSNTSALNDVSMRRNLRFRDSCGNGKAPAATVLRTYNPGMATPRLNGATRNRLPLCIQPGVDL